MKRFQLCLVLVALSLTSLVSVNTAKAQFPLEELQYFLSAIDEDIVLIAWYQVDDYWQVVIREDAEDAEVIVVKLVFADSPTGKRWLLVARDDDEDIAFFLDEDRSQANYNSNMQAFYNSNMQALAADLRNYASECVQFFNTPISQGGAGQSFDQLSIGSLGGFLGFLEDEYWWGVAEEVAPVKEDYKDVPVDVTDMTSAFIQNENGTYRIAEVEDNRIVLIGIGYVKHNRKYPKVITTVTLPAGTITASTTTAESNGIAGDWTIYDPNSR